MQKFEKIRITNIHILKLTKRKKFELFHGRKLPIQNSERQSYLLQCHMSTTINNILCRN